MSLLYLIATLPTLKPDAASPLTPAQFLLRCADWLNAREVAAVRALIDGTALDHPFVTAWNDKESILRNALAQIRARAAGVDPSLYTRYARGCDLKIESDAEDAMQAGDPLQKERAIDKIRWETVEELQGADPLSINTVFAYAVKLVIATRWSGRDHEKGRESFGELTEVPIKL